MEVFMFLKLSNMLEWVVERLIALMCIILLSALFLKVVWRYGVGSSIFGIEYLIQFCFVWMCLLGTGLAVRRSEHFEVDILANGMTPKWRRIHKKLITALIIFGGGFIVWLSYPFAMEGFFETEPSTDYPMFYLFFSMVIGGLITLWMGIDLLVYHHESASDDFLTEGLTEEAHDE
jgi:TRAP-type C4-dicarboxylate transport system permease small subunit